VNIGGKYQLNSTGQRLGNPTINMVNIQVLGATRLRSYKALKYLKIL
jgi:hypothetical protein